MRRFFILFVLTGVINSLKAQDTIVSYFDHKWNETNKANASFYRNAYKNNQDTWNVNDYYMDSALQMLGAYKSKKLKKKHGNFIFYFEDGQRKMRRGWGGGSGRCCCY